MTPQQLLHILEPFPYKARLSSLIDLGRLSVQDVASATLLTELEQGDFYERFLALQSCYGSYDGEHVVRALTDPSRTIRHLAIKLAPMICDEAQLRQALHVIDPRECIPFLWKLSQYHHADLIDVFLEDLIHKHDPQSLHLLPFGSATLMRRSVRALQSQLTLVDWRRLARHHPTIACEILQAQIGASTNIDQQLLLTANALMSIIAKKAPDAAVALITTFAQYVSLQQIDFQPLLISRPEAMIELMIRADDSVNIRFYRLRNAFKRNIDVDRLLRLIAKYPARLHFEDVDFQDMTMATRVALYHAYTYQLRDSRGCVSTAVLDCLPAPVREAEARRHLTLPALQMHPDDRLEYVAFLPWEEALTLVAPYLGSPSAPLREASVQALVKATYYQQSRLSDVLTIIKQRGQEQDSVRYSMLFDLVCIPPGRWQSEHLDDLTQIIYDALNARDISSSTTSGLYELVLRLLPRYPDWSAGQLAMLLQRQGPRHMFQECFQALSRTDVLRVVDVLQPMLEEWEAHEQHDELWIMADHFESHFRVRVFPGLFTVLGRVLKGTTSSYFADKILPLFVTYQPEQAAVLIPDLLQDDPSWITRPAISTYLHTYRQDLLTPFLSQYRYRDRFSTGHMHFVFPVQRGFACWTRRQQELFAETLFAVIKHSKFSDATLRSAIKQLAALPALPMTHMMGLLDDERAVVRDAALFSLSKMDAGQGMPILFCTVHDANTSNAVAALHALCLHISPPQALSILREMPLEKVRIAKEVVRILAQLPGEDAYQELLSFREKAVHRDVRVVFLRSLWYHLDRDEVWQILEQETHSLDSVLVLSTVHMSLIADARQYRQTRRGRYRHREKFRSLTWNQGLRNFSNWINMNATRVSTDNLAYKAQQQLMHLFVLLLQHSHLEVRATVLKYCVRVAAVDDDHILLSMLLQAMNSTHEEICEAAAGAVFRSYTAGDLPFIVACFQRLLPHRYALYTCVHVLQGALVENRRRFLPIVRALLTVLASDPLTIKLQVTLIVTSLPWSEVDIFLQEATTIGALGTEICTQAGTVLLAEAMNRPDIADIGQLEARLAISEDERLRRIALMALLLQVKVAKGWTPAWQERLRSYQNDPAPLVAAEAQFTFPAKRAE